MTDYYDWPDRERKEARENDSVGGAQVLAETLVPLQAVIAENMKKLGLDTAHWALVVKHGFVIGLVPDSAASEESKRLVQAAAHDLAKRSQ